MCHGPLSPACSPPSVHNEEYSSEQTRLNAIDANIATPAKTAGKLRAGSQNYTCEQRIYVLHLYLHSGFLTAMHLSTARLFLNQH